jgi:hypothetical protein
MPYEDSLERQILPRFISAHSIFDKVRAFRSAGILPAGFHKNKGPEPARRRRYLNRFGSLAK